MTLLRRLGNHSRRNRLYKALRELGRVVRTVTLLRYLSEPGLRDQIAAITNRTEAFHNFAQFLMIGGHLIGHNDPEYQGGFNRSSQHPDHGGVRWDAAGSSCRSRRRVRAGSGQRIGRCVRRCGHLAGLSPHVRCNGSSGG